MSDICARDRWDVNQWRIKNDMLFTTFLVEIGRFNVSHDAYHVSRDTLLILASVIPSSNSIIIIIISG